MRGPSDACRPPASTGRQITGEPDRRSAHRAAKPSSKRALSPPVSQGALRSAGLSLLQGADDDVEAAVDRVAQPGPFLALVHGDACPSNGRLVDGEIVLLDFATAGLRHALLDGVCGRVPFPSCWCTRRLPRHLPPLMEEGYRSELLVGCPAAEDEARFAAEAVAATA